MPDFKNNAKEKDYFLPAQEQIFWKRLSIPLESFAIGATHWWGLPRQPRFVKIFYYITLIFGPISLLSQICYFYLHNSEYSFLYLGNLFTVIMVTLACVIRLLIARKKIYKKVLIEFMKTTHIYFYEPKDAFVEETLYEVNRYNRWTACVMLSIMTLDIIFWMVVPIINNVANGAFHSNGTIKLQTCIYMEMPFDFEHNLRNWIFMHTINIYVASFGMLLLALSDIIMLCIVTHLIGRIKILNHNLEDLSQNFDNYNEAGITGRLHICVRDHVFILRFFKDMQKSHGLSVTSYYALNLIFDALLMLELKYGDKSVRLAYSMNVFLYVGGLLGISLIMEKIRIQSERLPNAVYNIPWERMSLKNQKTVLIFLARVQTIFVYKAFAGLKAGLKPALNILKTSFSYYLLLKAKSGT